MRRHETLHRSRPRCLKCGGPLVYDDSAEKKLAEARSEKLGHEPGGRKKCDQPVRLIPTKEAKRYEFWEYPDIYNCLRQNKGFHIKGLTEAEWQEQIPDEPVKFYEYAISRRRESKTPRANDLVMEMIEECELRMFRSGRPYYKVWPSICADLCDTEMRVDGGDFRLPHEGFEVRFPKTDNPLGDTICACVARMDGNYFTDGRDWSLNIIFVEVEDAASKKNINPFQPGGISYIADIPIKKGQSLEDALSFTAIGSNSVMLDKARQVMRVCVGVSFFGVDKHEVILPDLRRKVIDKYLLARRQPTQEEAREVLQDARQHGLGGFKVGSEIDLPSPLIRRHYEDNTPGEARGGISHGYRRRHHMRIQGCGQGRQEKRLVFVREHDVRPDLPKRPAKGYKVRKPPQEATTP